MNPAVSITRNLIFVIVGSCNVSEGSYTIF